MYKMQRSLIEAVFKSSYSSAYLVSLKSEQYFPFNIDMTWAKKDSFIEFSSSMITNKDEKSDILKNKNQSDSLINLTDIMRQGINLQRAQMMILCESTYNFKLAKQISKRTHWQSNKNEVWYYVISSDIEIEKMIDEKRKAKIEFTKKIFKMINVDESASVRIDANNASITVKDDDNDDAIWEEIEVRMHLESKVYVFSSINNKDFVMLNDRWSNLFRSKNKSVW